MAGRPSSSPAIVPVPTRPASFETVERGEHYVSMKGPEVYQFAVRVIPAAAAEALRRADLRPADVDFVIPHQANIRIIESATNKLGIPMDRTALVLQHTGNTSAASIPIALADAASKGRMRPGDLVLLSGFGAGMTWASAVLRWEAR